MKKRTARVLIGLGIVVALLALLAGGFVCKMKGEFGKMSPLPTKNIVAGIYAVNDVYVNMYFIKGKDGYVAVDAGNDEAAIAREMKKLGVDGEKVRAVFLTHTDIDHVAALKLFKNAKIYISDAEEQMINGKTVRMFGSRNKIAVAYVTFRDGQVITVGDIKVQCIATPGHTPGASCFVVNEKYIFTGDTLSLKGGAVEQFNELFNMDTATQKNSWMKIKNLPGVKYVFTAHYGYTDNYAKAFGKLNK